MLILPEHSRHFYMEVPPGSLCTETGGGGGWGGDANGKTDKFRESRLMYKNIKTLPETGINDSFDEMEPEFPFGIFCPEKEDYLSKCIFQYKRENRWNR